MPTPDENALIAYLTEPGNNEISEKAEALVNSLVAQGLVNVVGRGRGPLCVLTPSGIAHAATHGLRFQKRGRVRNVNNRFGRIRGNQ